MKITKCQKCGLKYPESFGQCPKCDGRKPRKQMTLQETVAALTDEDVKYMWNNINWEAGTPELKTICLAEYDKRVGLENWPAHISQS